MRKFLKLLLTLGIVVVLPKSVFADFSCTGEVSETIGIFKIKAELPEGVQVDFSTGVPEKYIVKKVDLGNSHLFDGDYSQLTWASSGVTSIGEKTVYEVTYRKKLVSPVPTVTVTSELFKHNGEETNIYVIASEDGKGPLYANFFDSVDKSYSMVTMSNVLTARKVEEGKIRFNISISKTGMNPPKEPYGDSEMASAGTSASLTISDKTPEFELEALMDADVEKGPLDSSLKLSCVRH